MSNEKTNEFLSWRGQLTTPDALPGQNLDDREQSWQRLADRLQKEPRRRGIAWWIAAACLIFAFFPATLFFRDRPTHPTHLARRPPVRREPVTVAPSRPAPATSTQTTPAGKDQSLPHSNRGKFAPINGEFAATRPNPPTDTLSTPALADAPATEAQAKAEAPPRGQLRIVYLNELNKDPGQSAASTRQPASLHLGFASTTTDWTTSQQNISIIKIDIPSHNH
jgi:hypothetical protein